MWNQPSTIASSVAFGLFQYARNTCGPLSRISPSSPIRTALPGSDGPTVPILVFSGTFTECGAVVSVRP